MFDQSYKKWLFHQFCISQMNPKLYYFSIFGFGFMWNMYGANHIELITQKCIFIKDGGDAPSQVIHNFGLFGDKWKESISKRKQHGSRKINPSPIETQTYHLMKPMGGQQHHLILHPSLTHIAQWGLDIIKPIKGLPSSSGQILTSNMAHVIILVYHSLVDHPRSLF